MFVGVAGFKPTMTDPNSVVLISYTIPQFKTLLLLSQVSEEKQIHVSKKPLQR